MKRKILFLQPSQKPVEKVAEKNMFYHMSSKFEGDAISFLVNTTEKVSDQNLEDINTLLPTFTYHARNRSRLPRLLGLLVENFYLLRKGIKLCRKNKYDVIVAHSTTLTGIIALILKFFYGIKVIVNMPTHPVRFYTETGKTLSIFNRFRLLMVNMLGPFIVKHADMVKLMYNGQVDDVPRFLHKNQIAFHDFVPVSHISKFKMKKKEKTILLVGTPWYIKGYDILIKAFEGVNKEFPEYTIHIIGKCSSEKKKELKQLSSCPDKIYIHDYMHNDDVIKMISTCSIYVNASRTEGVARVLIEAMALGKPIVASNIDGTPSLITHGKDGFLFENENVEDLKAKLIYLLQNPDISDVLGDEAFDTISCNYSEMNFVNSYYNMVERTLRT